MLFGGNGVEFIEGVEIVSITKIYYKVLIYRFKDGKLMNRIHTHTVSQSVSYLYPSEIHRFQIRMMFNS